METKDENSQIVLMTSLYNGGMKRVSYVLAFLVGAIGQTFAELELPHLPEDKQPKMQLPELEGMTASYPDNLLIEEKEDDPVADNGLEWRMVGGKFMYVRKDRAKVEGPGNAMLELKTVEQMRAYLKDHPYYFTWELKDGKVVTDYRIEKKSETHFDRDVFALDLPGVKRSYPRRPQIQYMDIEYSPAKKLEFEKAIPKTRKVIQVIE